MKQLIMIPFINALLIAFIHTFLIINLRLLIFIIVLIFKHSQHYYLHLYSLYFISIITFIKFIKNIHFLKNHYY